MLNSIKFLNILVYISVVLVIFGCGGYTPAPEVKQVKKEYPSWINSPKPDDNGYMYGVGIEENRQNAIKSALNDMVAKLGVTLESSYISNQEVQGSYFKTDIKNQIKSDIAKIKINNYEIAKSKQISYREFAVMIKVDKKKFLNGLEESLKSKKQNIELEYNALKNTDILKRYNVKKSLAKQAKDMTSTVLIASEIKTVQKFDKKVYLDFIVKMQKAFIKEKKSLNFYLYGDKKSQDFVNKLKNNLAKHDFKIVNKKTKNSIVIKISSSDNIKKYSSKKIATIKVTIKAFNNSQQIGGKSVILKERYNGSRLSVYKNAAIHFEQDIKELGLNEAVGINLDSK